MFAQVLFIPRLILFIHLITGWHVIMFEHMNKKCLHILEATAHSIQGLNYRSFDLHTVLLVFIQSDPPLIFTTYLYYFSIILFLLLYSRCLFFCEESFIFSFIHIFLLTLFIYLYLLSFFFLSSLNKLCMIRFFILFYLFLSANKERRLQA